MDQKTDQKASRKALLDDAWAKRVERPGEEFIAWTDTKVRGYQARVYADRIVGTVRYAPLGSSSRKRYSVGEYPHITMAEMRRRAEGVRGRARQGEDPAAERAAARASVRQKESALDLAGLVALYTPQLKQRKSSWDQDLGYLNREILPHWGGLRADQIGKADITTRLARVAERAPVAANRLRAALLTFFQWCVDSGHATASPMIGVKKPTRERRHEVDRVLSDAELVVLLDAIESASNLAPGTRAALRVLAYTGKRPNEIAGLAMAELQHLDDPAKAVADIPASRMKARRRHILPLTAPVIAIIRGEIVRQTREARIEGRAIGGFVFTSRFADRERLARHSLSQALRRLIPSLDPNDEHGDVVKRLQADPPTPKAFRSACATGMARLGIPREDRRAVLAHVEDDVLGRHYDAYDRLPEKRRALAAWAAHVEALLSGEMQTGSIVPLKRRP